jgi:hypothetical protein
VTVTDSDGDDGGAPAIAAELAAQLQAGLGAAPLITN